MTKFIVHIGDGKCGSTSVQSALYKSRDMLKDKGIVYETLTPLNGHFNLVSLSGKLTRSSSSADAVIAKAQATLDQIREELGPDSTVLLSAESFFDLRPDELVKVLKLISPDIDQLDLIAYVRPPHSMYLSLVQQILKADSRFPTPDTYARQIDEILNSWQNAPIVNSLTVRNFDRSMLVHQDVVPDFSKVLQDLTGVADIDLPIVNENGSLSAEQLVVLQKYRGIFLKDFDGKTHKTSQMIISYFEKLNTLGFPGSKPKLNDRALCSLSRANSDILVAVNKSFPTLALSIPNVIDDESNDIIWKENGSVAQVLASVDRKILALTKLLVSRFQKSVSPDELVEMTLEIRAVCTANKIDYDQVLNATISFWRGMKMQKRAEFLTELASKQNAEFDTNDRSLNADHPMVLFGKGDWLFLKADSNRVMDQITGSYLLEVDFKKKWEDLFEQRAEMARQIGYQYYYGIAPNKECVYADKLPDDIVLTNRRPVHDVMEAATNKVAYRYYLEALLAKKATGEDVFVTGDTHWNHTGALVAFNTALNAMGLTEMHEDEFIREAREIEADLSTKLGQLCSTTVLTPRNPTFKLIDDNKVKNVGNRRIYENEDKSLPTCVFFRDSFTSHQLEMFASSFSRIVFLWQPNIDYSIVKNEAPDFVINQQVERFQVAIPDDVNDPSHKDYEGLKLTKG